MTIGDEKVVAEIGPVWTLVWAGNYPVAAIATLHGLKVGDKLIPQSDYAEMAADRDLWMSMATFEGKVSASVLDDLHTTQAQLAELRGRVVAMHTGENEDGCGMTNAEIRTLAAADGGGK